MRRFETVPGGDGSKGPRKQGEFIAALLTHSSVEAAAEAAGISRATGWRWLKNPAVAQRLREARQDAWGRAIAALQEAGPEAVAALRKTLAEAESEGVRVSAARTVLELGLKAVELGDVLERLDAIERAMKSQASPPGPKILVTHEHEKDGRNQDGQNHKAPFGGTGGSHEQ
jgi:hypothetical protein